MPDESPAISVSSLSKYYKVPTREAGLRAAARSLFKRRFNTVKAVDDITYHIGPGEIVGFLRPNGAGKTTTLKILSGLLYPTGVPGGFCLKSMLRCVQGSEGRSPITSFLHLRAPNPLQRAGFSG